MFLRLVADSFGRRPRHKLLTGAALALGMGVATAALSVSLDVGDRLAKEFRSLGANLLVTPQADSLPLEIGGVDYRPVNAGVYLPEADLPKLKTIFWHNNIMAFSPVLEVSANVAADSSELTSSNAGTKVQLIGTWGSHPLHLEDGSTFATGIEKTNPWFRIEGRWFSEESSQPRRVNVGPNGHYYVDAPNECVAGVNLAQRMKLGLGQQMLANVPDLEKMQKYAPCTITGILSSGGPEDDALLMPLLSVQQLAGKPGQYRKLYVSALTKPEDAFAKRDVKSFTPTEYDRWSARHTFPRSPFKFNRNYPGPMCV
jgi:putative ABC transport system permease protein